MNQGQCAFSGQMIPKGSGIHRVGLDTKVVFAWGRREHNYIHNKVSARSIKWTETSRNFYHKTHKDDNTTSEFVPITKIVRGFSIIPKSMIVQPLIKPVAEKQIDTASKNKNNKKIRKNANVSARK